MKHLSALIAALALTIPTIQAKVYDITLNNADKYTQCQLKYKGSSTTKFSGTNKQGKVVTLEVPTSDILLMREVEEKSPEPAKPAPEPKADANAQPQQDAPAGGGEAAGKPAEGEEGGEGGKPAEGTGGSTAEEAAAATQEQLNESPIGNQVQNASVLLRRKLATIDEEMQGVRKPSSNLKRTAERTKEVVTRSLEELNKLSLSVVELQKEYDQACMGDYKFTIVAKEQRDQYVRDGQAAHKAMLIDMKEKPGARKVGGLDKFEIMRDRYQGIPEYKEAYEWYIRTLKALEKKWDKMLDKENKRRKSLQPAKKAAMTEADNEAYEKLGEEFKKDGEDIDKVWFNPKARNLRMLNHAYNRVTDTLRRNEEAKLDDAVGTVPSLLGQFWDVMDRARDLMVQGKVEEAEKLLDEDPTFDMLIKLKSSIFPNDYRDPIREQRQHLEKELKKRAKTQRDLKRKLERQASTLERAVGNAEARIDALMEDIQREKGDDAGDNTVDMEDSMNEAEEEEQDGGADSADEKAAE